jgi:hypothetical protein
MHLRSPRATRPVTPTAFLGPVPPATQESAMMKTGRHLTTLANFMQRQFVYMMVKTTATVKGVADGATL